MANIRMCNDLWLRGKFGYRVESVQYTDQVINAKVSDLFNQWEKYGIKLRLRELLATSM